MQPSPTQNAFVESFNGKFSEYCLDLHWFASLPDARATIKRWRTHYNHIRPHRSVGKIPPESTGVYRRPISLSWSAPGLVDTSGL